MDVKNDILIVGTSLDPDSRSQILARVALEICNVQNINAEVLDLRDYDLPMAGAANSFDSSIVSELTARVSKYHKIIFTVAIYNYDVTAAAKNFIELVGDTWLEGAVVGFICTAGGKNSYMSVMGFANSLMLDFRAWVAPRFVYVVKNEELHGAEIKTRIEGLVQAVSRGTG
jgi:FMN reductase